MTPPPRSAVLDEIRSRARDCDPVANVLGLAVGRPRQARRWRCPGPTCDAKAEATLATPKRGGWACHRCGEKGDALALVGFRLGLRLPLAGADFLAARARLALIVGVPLDSKGPALELPPLPPAAAAPERPPHDAAGWWAAHGARAPSAAPWLTSRALPPGCVSSGLVMLDRQGASGLAGYVHRDFLAGCGGAVVAPLRSAAGGAVGALHLRAVNPDCKENKRRTVGSKTDPDGTPRGYGRMDRLRGAAVVILAEGLGDTLAAEALADGLDAVAVGADGATCLPAWGAYLSTLPQRPRVVVVPHLDGSTITAKAGGFQHALEAAAAAGGVVMSWAQLVVRGLPAALRDDVLRRMAAPRGWDLADALAACRDDLPALRLAFAKAVGLPPPEQVRAGDVSTSAQNLAGAARPPRQAQPAPAREPITTTTAADSLAWTDAEWAELQADLDETWGTQ